MQAVIRGELDLIKPLDGLERQHLGEAKESCWWITRMLDCGFRRGVTWSRASIPARR